MRWKCVSDAAWDGELSGCTFDEDAEREVGLLHLLFAGNETVVSGSLSGILHDVRNMVENAWITMNCIVFIMLSLTEPLVMQYFMYNVRTYDYVVW